MQIPQIGEQLSADQKAFLEAFSKSCRHSIIAMLKNSQSGHPGGSLSTIDYLSLLYSFIISQTGEKIVVSNGHISPAVYSVLAEMKYAPKQEIIDGFRQVGSIYEGHVTRYVDGIWYGTGPLGIGTSVASAFALDAKLKGSSEKVYAVRGDGEADEGQVHEMANFAAKYKLDNLIVFVDYNRVQLTASLDEIMPINIAGLFEAAGWEVIEFDGHDYDAAWSVLGQAHGSKDKPVLLLGRTIMGKGVDILQGEGEAFRPTWHGKAPSPEDCDVAFKQLAVSSEEAELIEGFQSLVKWRPEANAKHHFLDPVDVKVGTAREYPAGEKVDCRSAYGNALLDLAELNPEVVALSADLSDSVKTSKLGEKFPERHIENGIAEQHMISAAGGLSFVGRIPFASTFGAFTSSRAKDQARVNDINHSNVKMVSTHCGISVGEDGPTHQAIDDAGSFLGMFNTGVVEPADANQTDHIIRFIASHYGNFYMRMGRHKFAPITKEDGSIFYDANYKYQYGKTDLIRDGEGVTVIAIGSAVRFALDAWEQADQKFKLVAATSIKQFDETLLDAVKSTGKVITFEDHNALSGLAGQIAGHLASQGVKLEAFDYLAVTEYQLSGKAEELYKHAGLSAENLLKYIDKIK